MSEGRNIEIETRLAMPDLRDGHDLYALLASALKSRTAPPPSDGIRAYWPASHFHLDKTAIYRDATGDEKQQMLEACSRSLLAEAYYIEKSGMYYAAKMGLLAESAQERMLYSMFAADEATHFSWISRYVSGEVADYLLNPFIQLLDEMLQKEDRLTLLYVVQVILEGWGIQHYHALAKDCHDAGLAKVLETIIKDEARHHGSGLVLFSEQQPSDKQVAHLIEILTAFFQMVQVGPQMVVSQIERVKGHLSRAQKARIFEELDCEAETGRKIAALKSLIQSAEGAEILLDALERNGVLRAFPASDCAAATIASR